MDGWIISVIVIAAVLLLVAVIAVRIACFKPKSSPVTDTAEVAVNGEKAFSDLQEMIRCKTVSCVDKNKENEQEFVKFEKLLQKRFPSLYATCHFEKVNDRALLYRWKGVSSDSPTVLMAHYDVVSAEESEWTKPPFDGVVENNVLWGRGTLDTKVTVNAILNACESMIESGFAPKNDIYLAFGGNEEISGNGAPAIVELFKKRGIRPELVLDEGGAVVQKVFPGVAKPCALIGIAEKGMLNVEFSAVSNGGHASAPPPHTLVGQLSSVCVDVENSQSKFRLTKAAAEMFDTLGRHSSVFYRMIFANLWLFKPVITSMCKKRGGELNALMRTTCAFTQMEGSKGMNVMPATAKMIANYRIISGETVDSVMARITGIVNGRVNVKAISGMNPSVVSSTSCEGWEKVRNAVASTWQDAIVSPYLMVACSDSRHYGEISDKVYRFSAMALSNEERASIHGNDEKITKEKVVKAVEFYLRLIKTL